MIKRIMETVLSDLKHLKTLLEEHSEGTRPLADAAEFLDARIDVYSEPERSGASAEEEVLEGLRDIVELAEGSIERMKRDIKRKREGRFGRMDWFYFFAWYGDCMEARGQLAVAVKLMPSEEVRKLWDRAVEAHHEACELRTVILGLKES